MSLDDAVTLTDLIREGRNNNFRKEEYCNYIQIGDSLLDIGGNLLDKYWDFIDANKIRVRLEDDYIKYKYRPKELSKVLYGTEELYFILLKLNNISSEIEFTKRRIFVADRDSLKEIINRIINLNEDSIIENHRSYL